MDTFKKLSYQLKIQKRAYMSNYKKQSVVYISQESESKKNFIYYFNIM